MGSKEGRVVEFLLRLTNVTRFQIEGKKYASAAAVFAGFVYGDYTGGRIKEMETQKILDRLTREYETRHQLYIAKAREMGISEADAN